MSYQVLARKWRPQNFKEMAGQEHVLQALINALDNDRLHHAYLFTGTRGVGKTTIARILAKCLNCEQGVSSEPCGTCSACTEIADGRFVDLIEIDAASHTGVDNIRDIIDNAQYASSRGRFKVYLIDEIHMLSGAAFNALLKTLEEPPAHVKFLLATTDPQKLPATILSRCLQFNLKNLSSERIVKHLQHILGQENIENEEPALWELGRAAHGSMRDALSLTDQAIGFGNGKISTKDVGQMLGSIDQKTIIDLLNALRSQEAADVLKVVEKISEHNPDYSNALNQLLSTLHRMTLYQALPDYNDTRYSDQKDIQELAKQFPAEDIQLFYQLGLHGQRDLPLAPDPRTGFEMILLRMLAFKPHGVPKAFSNTEREENTVKKPQPVQATPANSEKEITEIDFKNLSADNWHVFFEQLNLSGVIHNIANHCLLDSIKQEGDAYHLHLTLDEAHAALFNSAHQERLASALSLHSSQTIQVAISAAQVHRETPAAITERLHAERLAAAQQTFTSNANIQALVNHFDGKILLETIKPVQH